MGGPLILHDLERRRIEDDELRRQTGSELSTDAGQPGQRRAVLDRALLGFFVLFLGIDILLFVVDVLIP